MKAKKETSVDPSKRVVFVSVCRKCESINGKEVVKTLKRETIEQRLKTDENFSEYKDNFNNANYRCVNWLYSCIQC